MTTGFSEQNRIRRRVSYHGRVQGVGFRYTTASIARRFPVLGYIRNRPDGTVEMVVEATTDTLSAFLDEIAASFSGDITECESAPCDSAEVFLSFGIRY